MAFEQKKKGFFGRLSEKITDVVMGRPAIDEELLEELEYYAIHKEFLCKYKVAGYTVTDILVWQVDHFKAYLDRREEINRYRQDKLIYNSFDILLQMRDKPEFYVNKLQGETGTDYEGKY